MGFWNKTLKVYGAHGWDNILTKPYKQKKRKHIVSTNYEAMWKTLHLIEVETLDQSLRISIKEESEGSKDTAFLSSSDAIKNIYVNWYHNPDSWEKKLLSFLPSALSSI